MVRLPHLLALLCGLAAALAVGCGDRSNLIPAGRASDLTQQLSAIEAAMDAGQCDGLMAKVDTFHDAATNLSSSVDTRLRKRINQGAVSLQSHALATCKQHAAEQQASDAAPSDTVPPDTETDTQPTETATETTPTETSTETTPSDAAPPSTTTPVTPTTPETGGTGTSTTPSDNGGTSPDGETP